ncbi:MAG: putative bifunctional diguanylate cyclase/phosphodiesterase, partial [Rhodospirillaceae bacterium]
SAMYHAKSLGRNNFQFFDQKMNERSRELLSMETSLREALLNDKLQVLYQPQVDIETGEMVGVETLARWQHPTRGLIGAGNFLPFAEQSGLHAALDRTILTAACRQLVTWQSMSLPAFPVSVNICAKNFDTGDLHAMVTQVLDQTGADPNLLALEITESHVAREGTATVRTLEALRNMGIRIVIDDFGTGFASLSYLRKFPVDEVKIDKSFVQELPNNRSDGAIVRAVLALADELELKVIGEGVERQEQLQWLRSHGLRVVQGYLTGEPLSPIQIIQRVMHAETDPPKPHELSSERIEEPVTSGYDFSTGSFARRAPST